MIAIPPFGGAARRSVGEISGYETFQVDGRVLVAVMFRPALRTQPAPVFSCDVSVYIAAYVASLCRCEPSACLDHDFTLFFGLGFQPIEKLMPAKVMDGLADFVAKHTNYVLTEFIRPHSELAKICSR